MAGIQSTHKENSMHGITQICLAFLQQDTKYDGCQKMSTPHVATSGRNDEVLKRRKAVRVE